MIEDKRIDASGQGAGIYVRNTTKALVIRNCWVSNAVYVDVNWGPGANIMVYSDGPCIIENNRCDNTSGDGMKLAISNSRTSNNTIWGTQNGINLVSATYCTIENNTITGASWTGIAVIMASEHNLVANNTISNCYQGINLYAQGNDNIVRDNHITGREIGILADYGNRNHIIENNISSASHGIEIRDSTGNLVDKNEMTNNIFHLFLRRASENKVVNNTCRFGSTGLEMYDAPCYDNTIDGNLFEGGSNFGILIAPASSGVHQNNRFTNNTFLEAHSQGVYILSGGNSGNEFLNNAFIGCNEGATQAADFSYNIWNNSSSGNYWHDHRSPDDNDDGIVDIAYTIQSNMALYDQYPLTSTLRVTSPVNMSEIDTPSVTLSGTLVNHHSTATFTWNNTASDETGNISGFRLWTAEVQLVSGANKIHVVMTDGDGRTFRDNITVFCTALTVTVDPEEGSTTYTSASKFNVTVDATGYPGLADIYVVLKAEYLGFGYRLGYDLAGAITYHGTFELDLYDGLNQVWVYVNDTAGHMAMCSLGLFRDSYPPVIEFTYLPEGSYLNDDPVEITWTFVQ
ncbi:MAG TPA: NosD domain-containing protein, partial [Methanomassiliicoccales archaeon]|nr:NosD domain-containing protein [Methanomassiliicoccales archaeon]